MRRKKISDILENILLSIIVGIGDILDFVLAVIFILAGTIYLTFVDIFLELSPTVWKYRKFRQQKYKKLGISVLKEMESIPLENWKAGTLGLIQSFTAEKKYGITMQITERLSKIDFMYSRDKTIYEIEKDGKTVYKEILEFTPTIGTCKFFNKLQQKDREQNPAKYMTSVPNWYS